MGFLIESTKLLQPDRADISNMLLKIAESRQRLEKGHPQPTLASIQFPTFSVPMSALWINGLWFLSLGLSLSAAVVAMLAKEWLVAYNTFEPLSAHNYARLRQSKFDALIQWRTLEIIDLLPSVLLLALLLFAVGIILRLASL